MNSIRPALCVAFVLATGPARAQVAPDPAAVEPPEVPEQVLVITGTRTPRRVTDDPVGTERIGARELAARNVRDASHALEAEPGIQVERSFRGSSFQLRGLDAKYTRVLVDGQPLMGQVNDVIDLRRYAIESIDHIEIVRGASSALYGSDALAGVVNLISRRPKRPLEMGGFVQYGQLNQSLAGATVGGKRGDYAGTVSANWFGNDSYDLTPNNEDLSTNGDARRAFTATARGFWTASEHVEVMAFLRGGYTDSRGVDLQPPRALFNRRVGETEGAGGGQATWKPDASTRISLFLQTNAFARTFVRQQRQGPGADDMESLETLSRGELQLDHEVRKGVEFTFGAGGQRGAFDSPRLDGGHASVTSGWGFAQGAFDLGDFVSIVAGARLDLDTQFGTHPTPRLAARVKLNPIAEGLAWRIGYGQGFRAPSFGERFLAFHNQVANYVVYGNPDLSPETSENVQTGLEWAPLHFTLPLGLLPTLRVTGFVNALEGLIQPIEEENSSAVLQRFQYVNYSTARIAGVESSVRVTQGDWFIADVGYAWLDTHATLAGVTRALPGRAGRQLTLSVIAAQEETGLEVSARAQFLMRRSALDDDTALQPVFLADLRLAKRLWKAGRGRSELHAYVSAENLADVQEPTFLSLPGRLLSLGLNARY